jgi:hypothetical protein
VACIRHPYADRRPPTRVEPTNTPSPTAERHGRKLPASSSVWRNAKPALALAAVGSTTAPPDGPLRGASASCRASKNRTGFMRRTSSSTVPTSVRQVGHCSKCALRALPGRPRLAAPVARQRAATNTGSDPAVDETFRPCRPDSAPTAPATTQPDDERYDKYLSISVVYTCAAGSASLCV